MSTYKRLGIAFLLTQILSRAIPQSGEPSLVMMALVSLCWLWFIVEIFISAIAFYRSKQET